MGSEIWAIAYGVGSALTWGAADFSGGMASKRGNVYGVVLFSQFVGLFFILGVLGVTGEAYPGAASMVYGGLAGLSGALGLICLYKGLSKSPMALVAPVSAVVTAMLPVLVAVIVHGLPPIMQIAGFALALVSICLVSWTKQSMAFSQEDLLLPVLAGMGFGGFFVGIHFAGSNGLVWPLLSAKLVGLSVLGCVLGFKLRGRSLGRPPWKWILVAGILDVIGNALFVMASQTGRLDLASVLASLYPASTVLLAWRILNERMSRSQWTGMATTLGALALISMG
ncbi:MAG: DMT family transporter [Desulfatibacillum sp.]|nr:DMT family transporter [Desulfatibacillum sp.]